MRKFWLIWIVFILMPIMVSAEQKSFPTIIELTPKPQEKNYESPCIAVKFNRKISQQFRLTLVPGAKQMKLDNKAKECVWRLKTYATFRPKTKYKATLASPRFFIFQGKKTKQIKWSFTTSDEQSMAEQWEQPGLEEYYARLAKEDPLRILISSPEMEHFNIDPPDGKGVYTITLFTSFNAGVNGPPISEQEVRYKKELKAYKKEALDWIGKRCQKYGVNPKKIKIYWIP